MINRDRYRKLWWLGWDPVAIILENAIAIPFTLLVLFIRNNYLCSHEINCRVWGNPINNFFLIYFTSFLLFYYLVWRWEKTWLWKNNKYYTVNVLIILGATIVLFIGIFFSFTTYVKTTKDTLVIADFIHTQSFQPFDIPWHEISKVGETEAQYNTSTHNYDLVPYVILKDNSVVYLNGAINDQELINYINQNKSIN